MAEPKVVVWIDTEESTEHVLDRLFGVLSISLTFSPPDKFVGNILGGADVCVRRTEAGFVVECLVPVVGSEGAQKVASFGDIRRDVPKLIAVAFPESSTTVRVGDSPKPPDAG